MQNLSDKLSSYSLQKITKLSENISSAFKSGNLDITFDDLAYDEETKDMHDEFAQVEMASRGFVSMIKGYMDSLKKVTYKMSKKDFNDKFEGEYLDIFVGIQDLSIL